MDTAIGDDPDDKENWAREQDRLRAEREQGYYSPIFRPCAAGCGVQILTAIESPVCFQCAMQQELQARTRAPLAQPQPMYPAPEVVAEMTRPTVQQCARAKCDAMLWTGASSPFCEKHRPFGEFVRRLVFDRALTDWPGGIAPVDDIEMQTCPFYGGLGWLPPAA